MAALTLTDLPLELLVHIIATYLSTEDLGSLRLTSRGLEQALFDTFAAEFFAKKQFMLSTFSLQALVDISKHPALSKVVKHVVIGLEQFHNTIIYPDPDGSKLEKYRKGQADQFVLLATGHDREMLSEAFRNLPNLETVGIRDYSAVGRVRDQDQKWRSYGVPTILKETGIRLQCTTRGHMDDTGDPRLSSRAFSMVLSALADASMPQSINIEVILRSRGTGLAGFAFMVPEHTKMQTVLPKLRTLLLTLNLCDNGPNAPILDAYGGARSAIMPIDTGFVMDFLGRTSNLKHLRLNFQGGTGEEELLLSLSQPVSSSIFLPSLEQFDIGMIAVEPHVLLNILNRFSSTLRAVSFWKVSLKVSSPYPLSKSTSSAWNHFLREMSDMAGLNLERMSIGCLAQVHKNQSPLGVKFKSLDQAGTRPHVHSRDIKKDAQKSLKELIDDLYVDIAEPERGDEDVESDHDSDISMEDEDESEEDESEEDEDE